MVNKKLLIFRKSPPEIKQFFLENGEFFKLGARKFHSMKYFLGWIFLFFEPGNFSSEIF